MNETTMSNVNHTSSQTFGKLEQFQPSMAWNNYKERMEFYFEANGISNDGSMRAIFLSCVGESTYEIIRSLLTPLSPKDVSFQEIVEKLDDHFHPKPNEIVQRFTFHQRVQKNGESIADFVKDLRKLSEHCDFMELDKMLRDQIVCGVADESLQKRLFSELKLDFKRAYEISVAHEAAQRNVLNVRCNNEVMAMSTKKKYQRPEHLRCFRCDGNHFADKCFYKDKNCDFCKVKGHSSKACYKKKAANRQQQAIHVVDERPVQDEPEHQLCESTGSSNYFYELNHIQTAMSNKILTQVWLNGVIESFEVDSGAACTVISEVTWNRINHENKLLIPSTITLQTWSKEKLRILGSSLVNIKYNNKDYKLPVVVVAGGGRCLMGRDWFPILGISVQGVCALEVAGNALNLEGKFRNVFSEELGAHKGPPVSLEILPGSNPIFLKHRQCPIAWKPAVETEIEKLVQQKILEPVMFSRWATPIVPVPKSDGSVRICGDYRSTVNAVIKTNAYPLPTVSEVMAAISDGKVFTKLDLQQAYQQLVVDDASAELLTLNTHKGLYKVRRLPFGVSAAPGLFQKFMDSLLIGIKGVKAYLDDIIVSGKDESDHKCNLEAVFEKLAKANVTVNKNKCLFAQRELDFLGFHISGDGISPNKEKVRAIQQAPTPENKEMLQSFLGLLNFYNSFLPHKSSVAEKLHRLLDKNVQWKWTDEHQGVFNELKNLLDSD
ncbi:uncharacterized protein K02A2.6-like [Episyrphus balteatus]|uniref:uncharacterized protein K02A2.6-like n=1 Tax=Episyrphus balteatus TaxID=286459 RepID=UPI0024855331|nr:uncharacterized protein K02A2.6-like [Episyrphus balteatus]